jgi:hypothetical protein
MKGHKQVQRDLDYLNGPVEEAINKIRTAAKGLIKPELYLTGYGNGYVYGHRPMTPAETEQAARAAEKARAAKERKAQQQQEKDERALARLAEKLGKTVS